MRRDYLAWTPAGKDQQEDGIRIVPQHGIVAHQEMMNGNNSSHGEPEPEAEKVSEKEEQPEPPLPEAVSQRTAHDERH